MIEEIAFEYCRSDGISHFLRIFWEKDDYYELKLAYGKNGMYMKGESERFVIEIPESHYFNTTVKNLKIYSWNKGYPKGYIPRKQFMGVCPGTWSLDYKEREKKVYRHIYGIKGHYPEQLETFLALLSLSQLIPKEDIDQWKLEEIFEQ